MLDDVHAFLEEAARSLAIAPAELAKVEEADAEHLFDIELKNGKKFPAFRVQHNNLHGPYKGGIRFHANVNLDEIRTLATLMSLKTAAAGLPMGGGKGGVAVNPRELEKEELEELSRQYVNHLHEQIGPDKDVPAPDVNTDATVIDWMVDEYEKLTGDTSKASFTGKSLGNGGSLGRDAATGRGGVLALAELLRLDGCSGGKLTYAVQGYGNVGSFFATTAQVMRKNWRLAAASDSEAAVYDDGGLDASKLQDFKAGRGRFKQYPGAKTISNDELLGLEVDVLVLAGLEDTITTKNMPAIRAKYIVEMANGPIKKAAYDYLKAQGKVILPDIIANSGGVIVSYLEWLQNKKGEQWTEEQVNERLAKYMEKSVTDIYKYAGSHKVGLKEAAFAIALQKLVK